MSLGSSYDNTKKNTVFDPSDNRYRRAPCATASHSVCPGK